MKYSVILTAANEPGTIAKALDCILDETYSGLSHKDLELITVIPDSETNTAAEKTIKAKYPGVTVHALIDPYKGKPRALNLAFKKAQGEILILTDGDVYLGRQALKNLVVDLENFPELGGISGRPVSSDSKDTMLGYYGNLLSDAAHHKRIATMRRELGGYTLKVVGQGPGFFVLSGYICAIRNLGLTIPNETLVDDAYISYELINRGYKLSYEPSAEAFVKYPANLSDWYKQKVRSVGGYMQLNNFGIVKANQKVRSLGKELEYVWFPLRYAKNLKQLFWSFLLYPLRLYMWLQIFWKYKVLKNEIKEGWERVESTK